MARWRRMRRSVSTPRSSNRTCGFPASGFRTKVISCFRPREVGCGSRQPHQSQRPVKVFVRITASSGTSDFMFPTQPLTQPITAMSVHCAIDFAHRSKAKVIAPTPKQRIEFFYLLGRFAAQCPALRLLANSLDNPGNLLRAGLRTDIFPSVLGRVASPKAVSQEVEGLLGHFTQTGLLSVDP